MLLSHLATQLAADPSVETALRAVRTRAVDVQHAPAAARAAIAAAAIAQETTPTLVLAPRADRADRFAVALAEQLPGHDVVIWPAPEALPYEQLPFDLQTSAERAAILGQLASPTARPLVVVAPPQGLMQEIMAPAVFQRATRRIKVGDRVQQPELVAWCLDHGFELTPLVHEQGQIARRGSIIDIFPADAELPVRIDFFGDDVESLRTFELATQRSRDRLQELILLPPAEVDLTQLNEAGAALSALDFDTLRPEVATEWKRTLEQVGNGRTPPSLDLFAPYLGAGPASLLDHMPADGLIVVDEPAAVDLVAQQLEQKAAELRDAFVANGELPAGLRSPVASWRTIRKTLAKRRSLSFGESSFTANAEALELDVEEAPHFAGRMADAVAGVQDLLRDGWSVSIATDQVERLTELFEDADIFPRRDRRRNADAIVPPLLPGSLEIRASDQAAGWQAPSIKLLVLADYELFGFSKQTRRAHHRRHAESAPLSSALTPGDYVVHVDYGVGQYKGLVRMDAAGVEREYLHIEYAKGDRLYVPVDQTDRIARYSGGGLDPTLTKLGSGEWQQTRRRVRRAVREMALELVQLYASREAAEGRPFGPDSVWDDRLAESFPYTETRDQLSAINAVRDNMESPSPMDRLIVGDVGFGKTEVALRAAFKAVNDGRQVAVLVPTTVLALQHYTTFNQRLAAFPVRVEMLSRLRSKQQQREILKDLESGAIDIVIGTHRLVQDDVKFKDLGLVVIDEEQRFGVRQKEFLKKVRHDVDVISMSATPIPRTLHMALAGIRDISIIDTAPQFRLPIRTFVTPSDDQLIREVILRELDRGGQVYFIHNRVRGIERLAARLKELAPEARFAVGHGQMDEEVLEGIILGFMNKESDVLVSTTIIESGVDIPNVNTIIIDNADTLGLTQLYQLRGRVGRSTNRAYAYLLYNKNKALSEEAQERLVAIQEATELGSGMQLAMRDMEIRGAGNILGAEQSGHIAAVGYELYVRLLAQAVEEIRSGTPFIEQGPIILDLPITALIPADYIFDTELRLATYRRISAITTIEQLDDARDELEDRFGPIPDEVEHLLALIALRIRVDAIGIESIIEREREILIRPVDTTGMERTLTSKLGNAVKLTRNTVRIRLLDLQMPWREALEIVLQTIERTAPPRAATPELTAAIR
ncbi:MAG: transcription-repair coupling factor [Thermomicrobiales bacterium]